jgi:protease IV
LNLTILPAVSLPRSARVRLAATACVVAALAVAAQSGAGAQTLGDPELRPTRGPFILDARRAGDADATAVELNPGALALLPASDLEEILDFGGNGAAMPRRGGGAYLAAPIGLLRSALGLGLTRVSPATAQGIDDHTVFRLAYGLRPLRGLGLGFAWAHIWGGGFGGTDTFDFGLSARFGRFVALGVTVEDANQPRASAATAALPRLWTAELPLRPLGTDRLEIALGAAHADDDRWRQLTPRARLAVRVADGVRMTAEAETSPRGAASTFGPGGYTRATLGLAIDFDHTGGAIGVPAYFPAAGDAGAGVAVRGHIQGERRPSLGPPAYVARVTIADLGDDRAFVMLVRRLRALAADHGASAVLFKIQSADFGYARVEEIRALIADLRAHGKRTFAYVTFPTTREYYLASACDAVVLHPAGTLALTGVAQHVTFYKAAMDRIGVGVELVRVAEYKGAMEPFVMNEQSAPVRANKNALLDDVFARVVDAVASDRTRARHPMDAAEVRRLVDRGVFTPGEAMLAGLSDGIVAETELEGFIAQALGVPRVSLRDPDTSPMHLETWPSRRVAVLLVDGTMIDGPSQEVPFGLGSFAGSDTLMSALENCRRDGGVGAIVLRVNSPGGSAFASDALAREIKLVRAAGKPVIVSMGDYAASGGYYISAAADLIFAEPSTLTGSIGVFGYKLDAQRLLATLGLSVETYRRGAHADILSPYRAWTPEELGIAEREIQHLYGLFVNIVVEGRRSKGLTGERVDRIGRGHVWTGAEAQPLGLVDRTGGLAEAIDEAARQGGVPVARDRMPDLELLPEERSGFVRRLAGLVAGAADMTDAAGVPGISPVRWLTEDARTALRLLAPLVLGGGGAGFEARLPYDLDLR